ncbi:hypothetical protein ACFE04_008530 [Oxalis oulophora]
MEALVNHNHSNNNNSNYDHVEELENFLATKSGVKGLVDSGIDQVPKFFIQQSQHLTSLSSSKQVPIVDLGGLENKQRRKQIVNEIREAAETWGFFQLINHEVPVTIIDDVLEGVRKFNEQPNEVKTEFYCSDGKTNRVRFFSNGTVNRSVAANWKDSLLCMFRDQQLDEQEIPQVCRYAIGAVIGGFRPQERLPSEYRVYGFNIFCGKLLPSLSSTRLSSRHRPSLGPLFSNDCCAR